MVYSPFDFRDKRIQWATFLKIIRAFFENKGFVEVTTQSLVPVGAFESTIDPLNVSYSSGSGELNTSPEIEMKSILADFPHPIYQICKCFRDDPESPIHAKEFTMLEFYQPNSTSKDMERLTLELISRLATSPLKINTHSIYDLIVKLTGIDLELYQSRDQLAEVVRKKTRINVSAKDSWSDIFFKIMLELVEPALPPTEISLINEYPRAVSPLSKIIPGSSKAERFEIYWKNMELCNGCSELTDEAQLRSRYQEECRDRLNEGKKPHPEPTKLFQSASKIKNVSGVAVGLERLFLALEL